MAILDKDVFLSRIQERIDGDNSDEALSFLEDMTDTYNSLESKSAQDETYWKSEIKKVDDNWRERYKTRFFESTTTSDNIISEQTNDVIDDGKTKTYADLFEEKEG